jgi:ATP-dependent Lon protease
MCAFSLEVLRDESKSGHRKVYWCDAGKDSSFEKAGTSNPVFVLDEIDKLSVSSQVIHHLLYWKYWI